MVKLRVNGTRAGPLPVVELGVGVRDAGDPGENVEVTGVLVVGIQYRWL